jgi:hypothetical protein
MSGNSEAALYKGNGYSPINVPGAVSSFPQKIDTAGDIAYIWSDSTGSAHGALRMGGNYYKFSHPKGTNTHADGINDHRVIVGRFLPTGKSTYVAFKATY